MFFGLWEQDFTLSPSPHAVSPLCLYVSVSAHGVLPVCLCPIPLLYEHQSYWLKAHPSYLIVMAKTLFPNKATFTGTEV